jgi:hypothetical protein
MGERAQARVMASHTNQQRAIEFESHVASMHEAPHLRQTNAL